jgi:hypothetical protein
MLKWSEGDEAVIWMVEIAMEVKTENINLTG